MSEVIEYKGYKIKIEQDAEGMDPRENDNLGTMVCYSRSHNFGDKHEYDSQEAFKEWLNENKDNVILLPLFLYDHSGITMNTTGFHHCDSQRWDWGCVGVIYVTKEKVRAEYGWKAITKARIKKISEYLKSEVECYDQYLTGDVYGYIVESPKGEEIEDGSCWGFFGHDHKASGLLEQAEDAIDYHIKSTRQAHQKKLKALIKARAPLSVRLAIA